MACPESEEKMAVMTARLAWPKSNEETLQRHGGFNEEGEEVVEEFE